MVYALKVSMGWGKDQRREVFISISFVFWISKFHYVAGCFPVSAFSVCGKADVAAAGAIILICSTVKKKQNCSFCLCLKRSAMVWACQQKI